MRFKIGNNKMLVVRNPIQIFKLPFLQTWGITNKIGNRFSLMLDYDKTDIDVVYSDIKMLQEDFNCGSALVRVSSVYNYKKTEVSSNHVYFFKLYNNFGIIRKLVNLTRCDESFKSGWKYQARCLVLRIGEKSDNGRIVKPFTLYREFVKGKNGRGIYCKGLLELFEMLDNIKLKQHFKRLDNTSIKNLEFIKYVTK